MAKRPRDGFDRLAGALGALVLLMWLAYGYESATGLTFASRNNLGSISNEYHLAKTKRMAIGVTAICVPLVALYFAILRPNE